MNQFKVLYYPNSECNGYVLAKSILVFDEITFFDHPSLTFQKAGTVGHDSYMRQVAPALLSEGYTINVIKLSGGPVEGELQKIIDADLSNDPFRKTFLQLLRHDPSFVVHDGNYGKYGDADNLRKLIVTIPDDKIPKTVEEIRSYNSPDGLSPEIMIALRMAQDSYVFNCASYIATEQEINLFGDSRGMDMLLTAKLNNTDNIDNQNNNIAHKVAFTLLQHMIPNEAFKGKKIKDTIRFRNNMAKDREKFKEHILEICAEAEAMKDKKTQVQIEEIMYSKLLPEIRSYQNKMIDNWEKMFSESLKSVLSDKNHITQFVVTSFLTQSIIDAMIASAIRVGTTVVPHVIDYFRNKRKIDRENPYIYLMKYK